MSKEYGLAGLRVGFIVSKNKQLVASLKKWNESKGGGMGVEDQIKAQAALMYGAKHVDGVEMVSAVVELHLRGLGAQTSPERAGIATPASSSQDPNRSNTGRSVPFLKAAPIERSNT